MSQHNFTTLSVRPDAKERLQAEKPFETMDNSEMVHHLLDIYEEVVGDD